MGTTTIPYATRTWHPTTGCTPVSAGCANCWARRLAETRLAHLPQFQEGFTPTEHPERFDEPLRWRKPQRVFVAPMGDLFHDEISEQFIGEVVDTMRAARQHTFLVLTKRAERMRLLIVNEFVGRLPSNVWLGVSVEDQATAEQRIPLLLDTPAAVRWVSAEPLLGPLNLIRWLDYPADGGGLAWLVVGGESGPGYRPMDPAWARSLHRQCAQVGVAYWFKQHSGRYPGTEPLLDGIRWNEMPEERG